MAEIIPNPTIRFKMKVKAAIPQKAKKDHFFHMNKNIVNTTLANPSNPYMYHIQDGTFGYVVIMDEFHSRYVNAVPALAINIKTNQNVNNLPRFLPSTFCDTEPSNVSGIIFFLKINLLICYRKWTRLSMNLFGLRIKKFSFLLLKSPIRFCPENSIQTGRRFASWRRGEPFKLAISSTVRGRGFEPPRLAAHAPQACLATITAPALTLLRRFFGEKLFWKLFLRNTILPDELFWENLKFPPWRLSAN